MAGRLRAREADDRAEAERREGDRKFVRSCTDGQLRDLWADQSACPDPLYGEEWKSLIRIEMGRRGIKCD